MIQLIPDSYGREAFDAFVRSLLFANWESPDSPLRLNADLKPADLADAEFFLNARLFLAALAEENGAPATARHGGGVELCESPMIRGSDRCDWTPVRGLAPEILLPRVLNQMHQAMTYEHDTEEWILAGYILDPLVNLGLIETKKGDEWPGVTEKDQIRVTALWRKFIGFIWNEGDLSG